MVEVVPTLLCQTPEEMRQMARRWVDVVSLVQVDFADGEFVPNQLPGVEELASLPGQFAIECHLMVQQPEAWVDELLEIDRVSTVLFHLESDGDLMAMGQRLRDKSKQFGVALKPDTELSLVAPYLSVVDQILLLGVDPGFNAQPFQPIVVDRVRQLRQMWPHGRIEVDGGMTPDTATLVAKAGASVVTSGSYLSDGDPREKLSAMQQAVQV